MSLSSSPRFLLRKFSIEIFSFQNRYFCFREFFIFRNFRNEIHYDRWRCCFDLLSSSHRQFCLFLTLRITHDFAITWKKKKHRMRSGCSYTINLQYWVISLNMNKLTLLSFFYLVKCCHYPSFDIAPEKFPLNTRVFFILILYFL
jgi:hypothetical protein